MLSFPTAATLQHSPRCTGRRGSGNKIEIFSTGLRQVPWYFVEASPSLVLFQVVAMRPGSVAAKDLKRDEVRTLTVTFH